MKELTQFNWKAFNTLGGAKFAIGLVALMTVQNVTGDSWMTTGLVALFAWLANIPGPLKNRIGGMFGFTLGAIFCAVLVSMIGSQMLLGIFALSIVGFAGTITALWGTRAGMVGWAVVMYMIYAPSFVAGSGLENSIFAILIGVGVLLLLNVVGNVLWPEGNGVSEDAGGVGADSDYVATYALIIAVGLAIGSWLGQTIKTDPTMVAATFFFVLGFDARKTWVGGIARLIGVVAGIFLGTLLFQLIGPGPLLQVLLIAACFLCFATAPVHPSFMMLFLTLFVAAGWQGLQPDALQLTISEKVVGEGMGVLLAAIAIGLLQFWDNLRNGNNKVLTE